ncbi:short-chain dehydrogenase [Rhodococcus sp. ACS1]|uniref:SDR family oxidoreductase n=1 Tax=Rhodococcus TaxID=1827 RepID=UPI000BB0F1CD|nr:SDR family oxidoreductase [Rhodococcus sp. ACS1]PBC47986.1 short-chain dehydrogenase [Rhodococcus sp. ACS1]
MRTGVSERPDLPIALVIGGGGMGMSTARRLGQSHRIVLASLSADKNPNREAVLREDGIDVTATQCDITDPESVTELGKFVAKQGQLRTLAHVAALSPSVGDWRTLLTVNLIGATLIERKCLELARQSTAAIFVSSLAAHRSDPPTDEIISVLDDPLAPDFFDRLEALVPEKQPVQAYRLSKFAINRMCRRRATAWGAKGARIVSMSPGLIATPMGAREFSGQSGKLKLELLRNTPLEREGTMVETADAIEFLASDRASFITGTDLLVDGGTLSAVRAG